VKELLSGVISFPWQDVVRKAFVGVAEIVKISAKVKLMISGITALLMLVGTGILVWRSHQPEQEIEPSKSVIHQSAQQVSRQSLPPNESGDDSIANRSRTRPPDEESEEEEKQIAGFLAWLDSLEADSQMQDTAQSDSDSTDADERKKAQDEAAQLEHEQAVEAVRQQIVNTIVARGEVLEWLENVPDGTDFKIVEPYNIAYRNLGEQLLGTYVTNYILLTRDRDAAYPGGWIYELCIENGFTIGPDPYEVVKRKR
jgi:hypothetical protein